MYGKYNRNCFLLRHFILCVDATVLPTYCISSYLCFFNIYPQPFLSYNWTSALTLTMQDSIRDLKWSMKLPPAFAPSFTKVIPHNNVS